MEYLKQFKKHIDGNNLPSTVSLWQEYCLSDEVDPEEMRLILEAIKQSGFVDSFGIYVDRGLDLWNSLAESTEKDEILRLIFDIQTVNSSLYSDIAHQYLEKKYGMVDIYRELLRIVGLRDEQDFQGCIRNFDLLVHLQKGKFCLHSGGWGVGQVIDISYLRREISIEFDLVPGLKEISFKNAFHILAPMSNDHFLARRFGDPDAFEEYAKSHSVEVIKLLLKDLGDKTATDIKDEMLDLVIHESDWSKWWSSVRGKLKKDLEVIYPVSVKEPFSLNKNKLNHEDRLKESIINEKNIDNIINIIYVFIRDFSPLIKEEVFRQILVHSLLDVSDKKINIAQKMQLLFLLADVKYDVENDITKEVIRLDNVIEIIHEIQILSFKRRLLLEIKEKRSDWVTIYTNLLLSNKKHLLREFLYEEIMKVDSNAKELDQHIEKVISNPNNSPNAFIWFVQKIIKQQTTLFINQIGLDQVLESLFILMHHLENREKDRVLTKKVYSLLTDKRFEFIRRVFKGTDIETMKEFLLLSTKCQILSTHDINILYSLAAVIYPEINQLKKNNIDEQEDIIWTTQQGLKKITDRIEQIATKETIENAKEIEVARAHGDLRENSEYKFAMERRARLQGEMKNLSNQVKKMRVLSKEDIDTSKASIGTKVTLTSENGKTDSYILLGPFDADPEKNILSAQSKLAQKIMNKKLNDKIIINEVDWMISDIVSVL